MDDHGEKSMLGDWVSTELETAHRHLEDDPVYGAYDPEFFSKVLANIEMGDHQLQHALDEMAAAQKRVAELEAEKAERATEWLNMRAALTDVNRKIERFMSALVTCRHDDCAKYLRPIQEIVKGLLEG